MHLPVDVIRVGKLVLLLGLLPQLVATSETHEEVVRSRDGALMCPSTQEHFSYDRRQPGGPKFWPQIYPCCGGNRQSPRNLQTISPPSVCNVDFPSFGYKSPQILTGKLFNKGHDPVLKLEASNTTSLVGAPYTDGPYVLSNIHIHFNTLRGGGSEHAIDGYFYDAEVHLVHFKAEYGDVATAVLHEDGLLVIGLMLEAARSRRTDSEIVSFIDAIRNLKGIGKEYAVSHEVNLTKLLPESKRFYTYAGSLTTPPCSESVRWVVMAQPLKICIKELEILGKMTSSEGGLISDHSNDRPLQDGNTVVETNFPCLTF